MPTITTDQIAASFRTAIDAVVPRMTEGRVVRGWKYDESETPPRASCRWYRFEWDGEGDTPDGFMGPLSVDTTVTLSIIVDYGGIPKHRVKIIAVDDLHQLRDVLNRLKSSATGLRWVDIVKPGPGWDFVPPPPNIVTTTDQNQARIALQYLVRYMKARA